MYGSGLPIAGTITIGEPRKTVAPGCRENVISVPYCEAVLGAPAATEYVQPVAPGLLEASAVTMPVSAQPGPSNDSPIQPGHIFREFRFIHKREILLWSV